jgi:propionate CoA-transferase
VTERCVFRLCPQGLELIEIAPGIDLQKDILDRMDFVPVMHGEPALMDARIFREEAMKLRPAMLEMPMADRLSYDAAKNLFFLNFEGLSIRSQSDIDRVRQAVGEKLLPVGHRVYAIVNYDRFSILPELVDDYIDMVKEVVEAYYHNVTRFTSNTFLRAKLGEALEKRKIAARSYETAAEAEAHVREE